MRVNYEEIKRYFESYKYADNKAMRFSNMLFKIEELIDINTMKMFYPKNLFVEDKELEAYLIFDDKILRGRILEGNNIEIILLRFKDLNDIKCECICERNGYHKLTMIFKNGQIVVFDSKVDTNASWSYKFENQLKELLKLLIKEY